MHWIIKKILSIYLEEVDLIDGLKMQLTSYPSTCRYQYSDKDERLFLERLMQAEILQPCKGDIPKPDVLSAAAKCHENAEDKIVKFHDADFERAFKEKYCINCDITEKTILDFTELDLIWTPRWNSPILCDISDVAMFKNLTYLNLACHKISDITPLAGLVNLTRLILWSNQIGYTQRCEFKAFLPNTKISW